MEPSQRYPRVTLSTKKQISETLDPLVKEWFFSRFAEFSESQLYGVLPVYQRKNVLISAPTGNGKTLTSFLSILNYLIQLARKKELEDKIYCVYSSPLKALNNDIFVNLTRPLEELMVLAKEKDILLQKIRVGLRTGDTSSSERAKMAKHPPHIFITTPESLAIVLTTQKFVSLFHAVEFVIIDEIHSLGNKRGVYLSLSLERLSSLSIIEPVRIGLSATIAPLDMIANFLVGMNRECLIAEVQASKKLDISVLTTVGDLGSIDPSNVHSGLYHLLHELIQNHKTTVVFTNTRSATERVVNTLRDYFPGEYVENIGAHHSSLSKEYRFDIEERLRKGELKVVVTSTSLELGIDIGFIDLVIMLGSPKSSARVLQRVGRAGHKLHDTSKGRFIVLDRDDLVECAILGKESIEQKIDRIHIPRNCLDVLSQQIYGMAIQQIWSKNDLLTLIRRSYCFATLSHEDFMSVVSYLSGEYSLEHKHVYAKIWYDSETKQIGKRGKMARVIYMTNIGTIPEEGFVEVVIGAGEARGEKIGMVDEMFLEKMKQGDVFVLGGKKYQFQYARGMKAYVKAGITKNPTIPSWFSEMLPLSFDSALEMQRFRKRMSDLFAKKHTKKEIVSFVRTYCYCDVSVAEHIYRYFYEQYHFASIPHERRLVIEHYTGKKNHIIVHSLYGRRVNDALSRALAYLMARKTKRDIEIGINDTGFYFAGETLPIQEAFSVLEREKLRPILEQAIAKTEVLHRRFRHCAARGLMILRTYKGRRKTVGKQQMNSFFLLHALNKISKDFPLLREARREVLEDLMDVEHAQEIIDQIREKKISTTILHTPLPSPFALNLITQGQSDLLRIEDRISFLKRMHHAVLKEIVRKQKVQRVN